MMKHICIVLFACIFAFNLFAQNNKPAYLLYNNEGEQVKYSAMISKLVKADVIFIGEYHNSSVGHWLEQEIFESVATKLGNKLTLGMEMMEADNQLIIDEYMASLISEERFLAETYLWSNYKTDYAPIVKIAKERGIALIATNVPRRYARALSYDGVEALRKFPEASKQYFGTVLDRVAKVEISDDFFTSMMKMTSSAPKAMSSMMSSGAKKVAPSPAVMRKKALMMTQAQALKDAVMAHYIAKNLKYPFVHINGSFHSDNNKGIITYLLEQKPKLKIATITTVYQDDLLKFDIKNKDRADFYIVLPTDTHKTY